MQTRFTQIQRYRPNFNFVCKNKLHRLIFNSNFQLLEYWQPLEALEKRCEITIQMWMDFKNSFAWLMSMKKLIFCFNNFFGSGHFLIHQIGKNGKKIFGSGPFLTFFWISWIEKMAGAKKVVKMKNHFFHARQPREGIFDVCSPWCCIFTLLFRTSNGSCSTNFENWCLKMKFRGLYHTCMLWKSGLLLDFELMKCPYSIQLYYTILLF